MLAQLMFKSEDLGDVGRWNCKYESRMTDGTWEKAKRCAIFRFFDHKCVKSATCSFDFKDGQHDIETFKNMLGTAIDSAVSRGKVACGLE